MGLDSRKNRQGLSGDFVRRLDHLQAGLRDGSERVSRTDRIRLHVPGSESRDIYHLVHAWVFLVVTSTGAGTALGIIAAGGHR